MINLHSTVGEYYARKREASTPIKAFWLMGGGTPPQIGSIVGRALNPTKIAFF